jgi:predicted HTH transcriptional regulator
MQLKDISQWDLDYVRGLPVGEFDWLEFKDSRWIDDLNKCLESLSLYVSAFANYDGGYLVIGVADPSPGKPVQIDTGVNIEAHKGLKSWLEDIIPNLTDPPTQRFNIHVIMDPTAVSLSEGRGLIVIHIPPSDAAPHQAKDKKYYNRIGSKLSAIGHRAVLDILNRKQNPKVKTEIYINFNQMGGEDNIFWRVTNLSNVFARYVMTRMEIPVHSNGIFIEFPDTNMELLDDGKTRVWRLTGSNHRDQPLFPQGVITKKFIFKAGRGCSSLTPNFIRYQTFADNMPPEEGIIPLEDASSLTRKKKSDT